MTDQLIKKAMSKPNTIRRLVQWTVKLNQFDVEYRPQLAIKALVLANIIVEFTFLGDDQTQFWTIHADWSSIKELGGVGVVMISPDISKQQITKQSMKQYLLA